MYLLLILFLLFIGVFAVVNTPKVQTYLAQKLAAYLSKQLKTEVTIGRVEIEFIKTAVLHNLHINDLHHDTLIFVSVAKIDYSGFFAKENRIQLSKIELENGRLKIGQYANEKDLNIDFFIDFVSPPSKVKRPKNYKYQTIASDNFILKNIDFSYRFESDTAIDPHIFNSSYIHVKRLFAGIQKFKVLKDTISFYCRHLEGTERCGLRINELEAQMRISPAFLEFDNFKLNTNHSKLAGTFHLNTNSFKDYSNFEEAVHMKGKFSKSEFQLADAAYFNKTIEGLKMKILFEGEIKGTEASLKGKNLKIKFGENSIFKGNVSMNGLPNWDNTFTHLDIDELITNKQDLEQIQSYPFTTGEKLVLPPEIEKFGNMNIKGTFTGFESDFVATAFITTAIGKLETDIEMKTNDTNQLAYYKGKLKTTDFNLGEYYNMQDVIGKLTLDVDVNGHGLKKNNVNTNITGNVQMFQFNNYNFNNIAVNGNFTKDIFDGNFSMNDENAVLDFDGTINLVNKYPKFDFASNIKYVNLQKLGLTSSDKKAIVSSNLQVDIVGDNIDNLVGTITAENTIFQEQNKAYKINNISVASTTNGTQKRLSIISDIVEGNIQGDYTLMKIGKAFKKLSSSYVPSLENNKEVSKVLLDNSFTEHFTYNFKFLNAQPLSKSLLKQIEILPGTTLDGHFFAEQNDFTCNINAKEIIVFGYKFKQFQLVAMPNNVDGKHQFDANISTSKIMMSDSAYIEGFNLKNTVANNNLNSTLIWKNNSTIKNEGNVNVNTIFSNNSTTIKILPSQIFIQDSAVTINPKNSILIDSAGVWFNNMDLINNQQSISLNTIKNNDGNNELAFIFKHFAMSWLNPIYKKDDVQLSGTLDGQGTLALANNNVIFTATIALNAFKINDELLGNGSLICVYNDRAESIAINGKFLKNDYAVLSARGFYYPYKENENLDLEISLDKFSLKYAEIYTHGIFSNLSGYVTGDLILHGSGEEPIVEGTLELQKSAFRVDYLNTTYSFNGSVKFTKNKIQFTDIVLNDAKGNKGKASGVFLHDYFKDIKYKIDIEMNKLMCLNTNATQNSAFYGKAFASGTVKVKGDLDNVSFDIEAKSEKGTFFVIPLYGAEEVVESNFLEFVKHDTLKVKNNKKFDLSGIQMRFDLELTPDATIQMMFDPKVGDAITGSGTGNIKMNIDTKGDFTMFGNYVVQKGDYLFTLQNVINKKLAIEQGGTIQWTGDPLNADINLVAVYKLRTSLYEIYPADESKKRVPVECKLIMTDKLLKPTIKFDIVLPNADQTTRDAIKNAINSDNEADLNKQVFSLLFLGKFFPTGDNNSTAGESAKNNGSELLSNQLSNWIGQTFKNINLGVKYNSADQSTNREIAIEASKQLYNNRITIDGNFGYISNSNNAAIKNPTNIIGDVNIDYKITNDGKFRVKGFNRSNDYTQLTNGGAYTQGVGLIYREDFETFDELLKRYRLKNEKKNAPSLLNELEPDSLK